MAFSVVSVSLVLFVCALNGDFGPSLAVPPSLGDAGTLCPSPSLGHVSIPGNCADPRLAESF